MLTKIAAYSAIYIIWGSTYFFIKESVMTLAPFYVVGLRFSAGGLILLTWCVATGKLKSVPSVQQIVNSVFMGILMLAGANGLVTIAEKSVDSYLAALLVSTTPLVALLCDWIIVGKRVGKTAIVSVFAGIAGVLVLLSGGAESTTGFTFDLLLIVAAIVLWSLGTSLSKQITLPKESMVNATIQLLSVGFVSLILLQFFHPVTEVEWTRVSDRSIIAMVYLSTAGTLALVAYSWLLQHEPIERIVTYTFVNPLIAIGLGVMIAGETPVSTLVPGFTLILIGLGTMFYGKKLMRSITYRMILKKRKITQLTGTL